MIASFSVADRSYLRVDAPGFVAGVGVAWEALPYLARVLVEQRLREGDEARARALALALGNGEAPAVEVPFRPARILMQDYTAVPLLVDLASIRDEVALRGGDVSRVRPAAPVQVVIDHSVQVDTFASPTARARNEALELERNRERYTFLRWAEASVTGIALTPPSQGIVHQINLERLATVVATDGELAWPDTAVGTDSHTTMMNGLGVLGWGVGGLEAFAFLLGLAHPMAVPPVVGVRLTGRLPAGVGAADLVLALTARLRAAGVVGALVEMTGPGLATLSAPDRCTVANMAPEFGAMSAFFPVDAETLRYLRVTGRAEEHTALVEAYCRAQGLWWESGAPEPRFARVIEVDLGSVGLTLAGPNQPHLAIGARDLCRSLGPLVQGERAAGTVKDGDVVIAAITSCTNTSNPRAMLAAGVVASRAVARGLRVPSHVKTSLSPGSRAVTTYLADAGLLPALEQLGFHVVGYGCMTCNGGSGPLVPEVAAALDGSDVVACAVASSNRNFEGRVHTAVRAAWLASPAMVVALAIAGTVRLDLDQDPLAHDAAGEPVLLRDLWPDDAELDALVGSFVRPEVHAAAAEVDAWSTIPTTVSQRYPWSEASTYVRRPPYLAGGPTFTGETLDGVRALVALGDDVSTDHISPVGLIQPSSPAGRFLAARGVASAELNTYGSRRGNHEVMARGTFANPRLRNALVPGVEGGETRHLPTGERMSIHAAAERYAAEGTPLLVLAGRSYGMGSSRDWAAKGPWLLGVRVVLAESFERIHRANLCAMGILPLRLSEGMGWRALGLDGGETFRFEGLMGARDGRDVRVVAASPGRPTVSFTASPQVSSRGEWEILATGGMLPWLLGSVAGYSETGKQ